MSRRRAGTRFQPPGPRPLVARTGPRPPPLVVMRLGGATEHPPLPNGTPVAPRDTPWHPGTEWLCPGRAAATTGMDPRVATAGRRNLEDRESGRRKVEG